MDSADCGSVGKLASAEDDLWRKIDSRDCHTNTLDLLQVTDGDIFVLLHAIPLEFGDRKKG
jgi:hypothetical protein